MLTKTFDVPGGDAVVVPDPMSLERPWRRTYTAGYKAAVLEEYERLDKTGKGELLRREGLYTSLISAWRQQRDRGALEALAASPGRRAKDPRDVEIARLRGANEKLAKDLTTARRVIEVQGKLSALLEDLAAEGATSNGSETGGNGRGN